MQNIVKQFRDSSFVRYNAILFIGSLAVGFLNYLYYPVLGRLLEPSSFGEVQTLFSLFAQIAILMNVFSLVTVNIVANYKDSPMSKQLILELEKIAVALSFIVLIATSIGSVALQNFFRFESAVPFILLATAIVVTVPLTLRNAYLRGKQKFFFVSLIGVATSAGDLIFSVIFVLTGAKVTGAVVGLILAQSVAFILAAFIARRYDFKEHAPKSFLHFPDLKLIFPELKYSLLVLVCSLTITLYYSMDIIVVKHYFNAQVAGLYAGISTVGRIIFFITASITQVLMPAVKLTATTAENQQMLLRSFILLIAIGGITWVIFALAPQLIIRILMGSKYLPFADLLPRLGLVLLVISMLNLLVTYNLALRRYALGIIVIIGLVATFALVYHFHNSLVAIINSLLLGSVSLLLLICGWMTVPKVKSYLQA